MHDLMAVAPPSKSPVSEAPRLSGAVVPVAAVTAYERAQMYELFSLYFAGTSRAQFERDLAEKDWAIVLRDALTGAVQGFSTLLQRRTQCDGQNLVAFFSGDTIIAREYWGETVLPRLWGKHVFRVADRITDARVYWLLICSGYKTWRYLPVFFHEFYPHHAHVTPPAAQRLMEALGQLQYGEQYDAARGIVRLRHATPLHEGVAELTEQRLRDPHVAFFAARNPGHVNGDELACLAEIARPNLTRAAQRLVGPPAAD